ncbi:cell division protein ZipA C-terminal FtsZ-binding domain-containing protein [Neisseria animalis]|uniref:Cell division protein ZipA n=1 Tax=Neisseria animalis TaxID=492 RepID=A0A5P3MPI0_NEIAN|nr:cell division protein ZipA C-terminal FtsZ-binding domain-containing protein [Neisseria animalis]QEY23443.1 cell division protein ZipA [Neisseria animalis]ROW33288.1 cell division protein ZipA [Neisseria animalis]VEE08949.1 ZipA, C-terminal FtsZ-binding domain [Neisseria animalis]
MIIIVLGLAIILAVIAYNMYQENQYRKQVREQFGHSDKDALLASKVNHVRDNKETGGKGLFLKKPNKAQEAAMRNLQEQDELFEAKTKAKASAQKAAHAEPVQPALTGFDSHAAAAEENTAEAELPLISLEELAQSELPWFDPRFDYLAYIALDKAQELHSLPRLSESRRFQIIGCTTDDRFQVAEPIPGVHYQAFVMGLQAVSRSGVAAAEELEDFNRRVDAFAQQTGGRVKHTDTAAFTEVAQALDNFCVRVDQTIALHLVSQADISGSELRATLENAGFQLGSDGLFHFADGNGCQMFAIGTMDNTPFSGAALAAQNYQGFSMLLDIPHVPAGEKTFDQFMDLAVKLSGQLSLNLVNDKLEEVSTQWLKDVRNYVLARQEEMLKVGIKPGSKAAKRLFS